MLNFIILENRKLFFNFLDKFKSNYHKNLICYDNKNQIYIQFN